MKSTIQLHRPPLKEYPRLKGHKNNGVVVLFTDPCTGTVVGSPGPSQHNPIGLWSDKWVADQFADFYGSVVILENE